MELLFVYGSLQPGGDNEHVLADLAGSWTPASVRGVLTEGGWGASMGYPGLTLDPDGPRVRGFVFRSAELATSWPALDEFEGDEYWRVTATVTLENGEAIQADVYVLADPERGSSAT